MLLFFSNFVWFNGDLRLVIFISPVFFFTWILSFFDYYFQVFFFNHCNYIPSILSLQQIYPVKASLNNLTFELTSHGINKGYTKNDMRVLMSEWDIAAYLSVLF